MKTLISEQQAHIDRILAMTPYAGTRHQTTLLNRKVRSLRASRAKYRKSLESMGFSEDQIRITMQDAEDMAQLTYNAEY